MACELNLEVSESSCGVPKQNGFRDVNHRLKVGIEPTCLSCLSGNR